MAEASDIASMRRALDLARRGEGRVEPNPMVGAVICGPGGAIVAEGWHDRFGGPHAEAMAIAAAGGAARGGTLYVTLEPCCHHGKTPPCSEAIIAAGIRRVVVAAGDPFPEVAGGGIAALEAAGISVEVGLLAADAERLTAPFRRLVTSGRPWVIAKWAVSLDGRLAAAPGGDRWISSPESRELVHRLRG
ncbi:MAG: bifunctional diaminohydroxyphosphoribosylaminopyrimidine deaminase/5-amino-6-(5-phosphoribosylamino)uracil reductase RibD, partial [Pirellulales bacterium]|nr:bifunctional diaminohydroxyphosphoribosylaminopyrimidine deaminase/5-amino-6-(5-phosphoribosylamino)uracil reductase RibD [Pirellulales bacterium]